MLNQESRIAMRILTLEIANGITNQSQMHDQHKPAKKYQVHGPYKAAAPVSSIPLVFLGRLVLVMHSTLIGYAIGYLQSQNPHGYPGLLI